MARRRRSSSTVTYDSRETRTVIGLLAVLCAIVLTIAAFVAPSDNNLFTTIRVFFGHTTIMAAVFAVDFALLMFESKLPFASKWSVAAQFVLMLLIPAFLASFYRSERAAVAAAQAGLAGGTLGYELAFNLFADTLVFGQYTPLILGLAIVIFIPLALSMSVAKIVEYLSIVLGWVGKGISVLFAQRQHAQAAATATLETVQKAKRFGDFQRQNGEEPEKPIAAPQSTAPETAINTHKQLTVAEVAAQSDVQITEGTIGEDGISQSELAYPNWQLPPVSLLAPYKKVKPKDADTDRNAQIIEQTLASFNIDAEVAEAFIGPSIVRYALSIPLGTKVSKIANLAPTLALGLGVDSKAVRVDTIPGTTYLGIEVPRQNRDYVQIRELMETILGKEKPGHLPVPVGKDIDGSPVIGDLQGMPHLLVAGATGSGKSILTNSFIVSLLMTRTPDEVRLILVDPKQVELMDYNGIPHLLTPVITDMDKVVNALKWSVNEMERRYTVLAHGQVRNLEEYNKKMGFAAMPYIVLVIDEMADMMMTANRVDAENAIVRLTQKARAVGIHLVLATQRPSVNVITGLIKANVPARIGMSVTSAVDSRVILDFQGAESLMGRGDLLFHAPGHVKLTRLQGPFVSQEEVIRVVNFIKAQTPEVQYMTSILEAPVEAGMGGGDLGNLSDDDQFTAAVRIVVNHQKGSASFLQRKLGVGFNRAARLLEEMEEMGIVGPAIGSKPREVLISDADGFLAQLKGGA